MLIALKLKEWLNQTVGTDDLERHDKWLCMMWPRLQVLKELLSDDGVICISCDDTEIGNLVSILNEIFGDENREEIITWRRRHNQPNDKSKPIAKTAEFMIIYAKNIEFLKQKKSFNGLPLTGNFSNPDNDLRGAWGIQNLGNLVVVKQEVDIKLRFHLGKVYDEEWLGTKSTFEKLLKENRIVFPTNGAGLPRKKIL